MMYATAVVGLMAAGASLQTTSAFPSSLTSLKKKSGGTPAPPKAPGLAMFDFGDGDSVDVDGNEGDEGDEGSTFNRESGSTSSSAVCSAAATAASFSFDLDLLLVASAQSADILCNPDRKNQIDPKDIEIIWDVPAVAVAKATADAIAGCVSSGDALGCSYAQGQAAAWAEAHALAIAKAYAEAFNGCGICDGTAVQTEAEAEVSAATFVELFADTYSNAVSVACVSGDDAAFAAAWSDCFARSLALLSAKAAADGYISGNCHNAKAEVFVLAATDAKYFNVEECVRGDFGVGNASGNTDGSFAHAGTTTH